MQASDSFLHYYMATTPMKMAKTSSHDDPCSKSVTYLFSNILNKSNTFTSNQIKPYNLSSNGQNDVSSHDDNH
ncbi:uncharacterized protein DS421_13g403790 [Arachis hypogaea]|nr:uncharacterized protein DS421_13g403790 [Arachis hypogaea]